ncbi:MAG: hypothetical protein ABIN79_11600 [Marmoricola sp.]
MRRRTHLVGTLLLLTTVAGCGESAAQKASEKSLEKAADRSVCSAKASAIDSVPKGFPEDFPFPDQTIVYDAEDRGEQGVILTGISKLPFKDVLAALNGPAQDAGFKITEGETEDHDAEANWTGNGYRGRWAIRESGSCQGETVVQVLAASQ